jgi:hypothetical protein
MRSLKLRLAVIVCAAGFLFLTTPHGRLGRPMWPSKRQALEPTTTIPITRLRLKLHFEADPQMTVQDSYDLKSPGQEPLRTRLLQAEKRSEGCLTENLRTTYNYRSKLRRLLLQS